MISKKKKRKLGDSSSKIMSPYLSQAARKKKSNVSRINRAEEVRGDVS